jgi:pimeloyl-ACP methyl ester carboxylesterase
MRHENDPQNSKLPEKYPFRRRLVRTLGIGALLVASYGVYGFATDKPDNRLTDSELIECIDASERLELSTQVLPEGSRHHVESAVYSVDIEEGAKGIGVMVADGSIEESDEVLVFPLPYNLTLSEVGQGMVEALASGFGGRVVAVELPGVGDKDQSSATWPQIGNMLAGSFEKSAWDMTQAIYRVEDLNGKRVSVVGYSMGADTGAEVAKDLLDLGVTVEGIVMVDPVDTTLGAVSLQMNLGEEGKYNYQTPPNQDGGVIGATIPLEWSSVDQVANMLISGVATKGGVDVGLLRHLVESGVRIDYFKLASSSVSGIEDACYLGKELGAYTTVVGTDDPQGAHHMLPYNELFMANLGRSFRE